MKRVLLIGAILLFTSTLGYALEVPLLKGRVNDYGNMISPETRSLLEGKLEDFEASDSTQVVILTVESLEDDSMEDFTIRVAEKWEIGQKKKDNGVILFASKNDRRIRIETGRGLEGVLTDLLAGRILDNVICPLFRAENFDEGFIAGTEAIIQACRGELKNDQAYKFWGSGLDFEFFPIIFIVLIVFLSNILKLLKTTFGYIVPVIILIIMFIILSGLLFAGLLSPFFFVMFLFILIFAIITIFAKGGSGNGWSSSNSGWSSSSRGGFSGGGGSFGGGGASGRW